ncbi:predicted protein [Streptomyces lividans TK24]|nr:predicted protein [Streptomyces lividans TK24]
MPNVREAGRPARRCATLVAALLLALVPFGAGAPGTAAARAAPAADAEAGSKFIPTLLSMNSACAPRTCFCLLVS